MSHNISNTLVGIQHLVQPMYLSGITICGPSFLSHCICSEMLPPQISPEWFRNKENKVKKEGIDDEERQNKYSSYILELNDNSCLKSGYLKFSQIHSYLNFNL